MPLYKQVSKSVSQSEAICSLWTVCPCLSRYTHRHFELFCSFYNKGKLPIGAMYIKEREIQTNR